MAEEWVDHSFDLVRKAENKLETTERAYAEADKKAQRNAKSALKGYEEQAAETLVA